MLLSKQASRQSIEWREGEIYKKDEEGLGPGKNALPSVSLFSTSSFFHFACTWSKMFGQDTFTCDDLRSVSSRSNLHQADTCFSPFHLSQRKLSDSILCCGNLLGNEIQDIACEVTCESVWSSNPSLCCLWVCLIWSLLYSETFHFHFSLFSFFLFFPVFFRFLSFPFLSSR